MCRYIRGWLVGSTATAVCKVEAAKMDACEQRVILLNSWNGGVLGGLSILLGGK